MTKITNKTLQNHFSQSYFVLFLLILTDSKTNKELHSEEVAVTFINRESKHLYGYQQNSYQDHALLEYYLKTNTRHCVEEEGKPHYMLFFTNKQLESFENLVMKLKEKRGNIKYETCHIETFKGDALEVRQKVKDLQNKKDSIIW